MKVAIAIATALVANGGCKAKSQDPPAPKISETRPADAPLGSAADAAIPADPVTSFYCFHDPTPDPDAVKDECWRSKAACDKYARQVGPDKPPACAPVPSVYCYTSTDETGTATSCTPARTDCDKLRTTEAEHNRHDPKLTACAEQH